MTMKKSRIRHIAKAMTWRFVASATTFILALIFFKDDPKAGEKATYVAMIEASLKLIFYYYHERFWFTFKTMSARKRHLVKSVTWRAIATLTTFGVAMVVFRDDPNVTEKASLVAFAEIFIKMLIYYLHEETWYLTDFGLDEEEIKDREEKKNKKKKN